MYNIKGVFLLDGILPLLGSIKQNKEIDEVKL